MNKKSKRTASILINLAVVIWMAVCLIHIFDTGATGNMSGTGKRALIYFTIESNILAAVSCLIMLIARVFKDRPGRFAVNFKYMGTVAVTVTLMTVVCFLGPVNGYKAMLSGDNLYMHLIGPLLCIISFCFFDSSVKLSKEQTALGLVPTVCYGAVYFVQVVIRSAWRDFYGFNRGGRWYISMVAMVLGTYVICLIIKALHNDN